MHGRALRGPLAARKSITSEGSHGYGQDEPVTLQVIKKIIAHGSKNKGTHAKTQEARKDALKGPTDHADMVRNDLLTIIKVTP